MVLTFNTHGNDKQKECIRMWNDNIHTRIAYGGGIGSGKSFILVMCIFGNAMLYPNTTYAIGRSELKKLRQATTPTIKKVFKEAWGLNFDDYCSFNGQDNFFTLYNGSKVWYIDMTELPNDKEDNYQRFGSLELTQAAVEEAGEAGITKDGVDMLFSRCGRQYNDRYNIRAKGLITFNPTKNFLYHNYYLPYKNGTLKPHECFIEADIYDNKTLSKDYIDDQLKNFSEAQKQRLIFKNWDYDDDPACLVSYDAIQDLFLNDHVQPTGVKYISADLAMQGKDLYVDSVWDGLVCRINNVVAKCNGKDIENMLRATMIREGVTNSHIVADSDGMGNYLSSYLEGIRSFHGNASSDSIEYRNKKDRCGYKLAELINDRKIKIICTPQQKVEISKELGYLKTDNLYNDTQKKTLMSKADIIKQLGHSPNYLDNLLMRMDFEIKKKDESFVSRESTIFAKDEMPEMFRNGRIVLRHNQIP